MWYFWFFFVVLIFSLIAACCAGAESGSEGEGVAVFFVTCAVLLLVAWLGCRAYPGGRLSSLSTENRTVYTLQAKYEAEGAVILYVDTSNGFRGWYYKVLCDNLVGGCPKEWPKKFSVKPDTANPATEKLILVPVSDTEK